MNVSFLHVVGHFRRYGVQHGVPVQLPRISGGSCSILIRRIFRIWIQHFTSVRISIQRWNSWTAFLLEASRHKLESSQAWVFVWFSPLISTRCYSWIDSSFLYSWIFFACIFKTRAESGFFKIPPVERLWVAWSKRLESFVKFMSESSISGFARKTQRFYPFFLSQKEL
jgi:hypothetical protein